MAYQLKFNNYSFPRGFYPAEAPGPSTVPSAKLPRADGARILPATLSEKKITVRGTLFRDATTTLRQKIDALKAALATGPAPLYFDNDRYWRNCQKETLIESYEGSFYGRIAVIEVVFLTGDPFAYETAQQTFTQELVASPTNGLVIGAGGSAIALPQVQLTVGTSGSLTAMLTNTTSGDICTLSGPVTTGQTINIDSLLQAVMIGGVDSTGMFDGLFPRLFAGANTINLTWSGVTLSQLQVQWQNRWF